MNNKKRLMINLIASFIAFTVQMGISFLLTPYIVRRLGSEAFGFISLANDFVNYASLMTLALNAMASRFIAINLFRDDKKSANEYYNSTFFANIFLVSLLLSVAIILTVYLERIVEIPANLVSEVKLTFAIVFINFGISIFTSMYTIGFFIRNRLDKSSVIAIKSTLLKAVVIIFLYLCFKPKIIFAVLAVLLASIYSLIKNIEFQNKNLPEVVLDKKYFKISKIKELLAVGIWNVITKLSQILTSGLDLLMSNVLIGATQMGVLSIAKTVPNVIILLNSTLANIFNPDLTKLYALKQKQELVGQIKISMKFISMTTAISNATLIAFGYEFFSLWVPTQDAGLIQVLSILTVVNSCITGPLQPIYSIITIANRVKTSSKVMLVYGVVNCLITLFAVKYTSLGLYAIAGVSLIGSLVVSIFFYLPFGAKCLELEWYAFFPDIGRSIIAFLVIIISGVLFNSLVNITSWMQLVFYGCTSAGIGSLINIFVVLDKKERVFFKNIVINKLKEVKK
ncbi:lipopolysaccharide biosynthesis protein [Pseudobacteroides cellulosolvens]|uniref:Polysaccharide biosynthesis protein n=1 Tax=Pseudobacteroides cellulosolvens ATCC 35603 = DSM 2933 TaxID=398512 RepID=A0A0L6JN80_9FIRM|nr:oligosaccharide flippase family protein [Pseudobacteroides cellulosolvens]KNY26827.1 polysaccharide biosynthesis protein [Pseudobacteroides cellulosolvens ATCC 35603 = DSM 2933]